MIQQRSNITYTPRPSSQGNFEAQNGTWVNTLSLEEQKKSAEQQIDFAAEESREKYITSLPGQVAVYNEKYLDAKAYAEAGYPTISGAAYPFVQAEAAAMNATLQQAADLIIATREMWITLASKIEEERRRGKINVDVATNETEINNAKQAALDALSLI